MTYQVTLLNTLSAEELIIDVEQTDAFRAQEVAKDLYSGYRVTKVSRSSDALLNANPDHTEGALGDF